MKGWAKGKCIPVIVFDRLRLNIKRVNTIREGERDVAADAVGTSTSNSSNATSMDEDPDPKLDAAKMKKSSSQIRN